jgi:hypothetical protein
VFPHTDLQLEGGPWKDRPFVTGGLDNWVTYQDRSYKLMQCSDNMDGIQKSKLYDLRTDPVEQYNIAHKEPALVKELCQHVIQDAGGEIPRYQRPKTFADGSKWHRSVVPDS